MIPAAQPEADRFGNVQERRGDAIQFTIHVNPGILALVRMDHMIPSVQGERAFGLDIRKVALNRHSRRAEKVHHDLPRSLLFPPRQNRGVRFFRSEPGLRRHWADARRKARDLISAEHPLPCRKVPGFANHPTGGAGADIFRNDRAGLVPHGSRHVPNAHVAVGAVEHVGATRLARRVRLAPIDPQLLARIALEHRNPHPNAGSAVGRIPFLDLVAERHTVPGGKTNIRSVRLGLAEIKELRVEPHQQRKINLRRGKRQVRPLGCGQDVAGPRVPPSGIRGCTRIDRREVGRGQKPGGGHRQAGRANGEC